MEVILPIEYIDGENSETISLPISLPISFDGDRKCTVSLPVTLPFSLTDNKKSTITLPVTLPISFESKGYIKKSVNIPYYETVNLKKYHGIAKIPYHERPTGKVAKIGFKEHSWKFEGLILNENVITTLSAQQTLTENIQSLILVDFELMSTNKLKFTWYGNSVPSFTVMMKSYTDENYTRGNTYNWSDSYGVADIKSEDYQVYLQGTADSGTSAIYTIAGANTLLVLPTLQVNVNEKIYSMDIENISEYRIEINY